MSFSGEVKEELSAHYSTSNHCRMAELAALLSFCGQYGQDADGNYMIGFQTENEATRRKGFTLLQKTFHIEDMILNEEQMKEFYKKFGDLNSPVSRSLLKNACCQRAFLRGAFLSTGSISDPAKGYHMEFVCPDAVRALHLQQVIKGFEIDAKIVVRKKYFVVYLKEGTAIVDLLNIMEAHVSLMNLENLRIVKEMRNSINRRVNCETANISKTVNAASRQIEDITFLRDHYGLQKLPVPLREMAEVRLENPDAPLKELGEYLNPPVGKSGVNHRLRKLSEIADKIREQKEDLYDKEGV